MRKIITIIVFLLLILSFESESIARDNCDEIAGLSVVFDGKRIAVMTVTKKGKVGTAVELLPLALSSGRIINEEITKGVVEQAVKEALKDNDLNCSS